MGVKKSQQKNISVKNEQLNKENFFPVMDNHMCLSDFLKSTRL
jgi:hypothetical protein